jgi:hypothetical protein
MQLNVEYFFRLFYECFLGSCYGSLTSAGLSAWAAHLWVWIINVGYVLSVIGLFVVVYVMMRLFELRKKEKELYETIIETPGEEKENPRWQHIESLINGATASEWREAIIESDIMLDDILLRRGYIGDGVGEKLKSVEPKDMKTLQDAWEAHKVRNQIAHEGSAFDLTETLARRTIARYENVFRELKAI